MSGQNEEQKENQETITLAPLEGIVDYMRQICKDCSDKPQVMVDSLLGIAGQLETSLNVLLSRLMDADALIKRIYVCAPHKDLFQPWPWIEEYWENHGMHNVKEIQERLEES
jgi:hypothetical protein